MSPCFSPSFSILSISRIPSTHIMMNPYLYPWCVLMNSVIRPPKLTMRIRRRNILTIRVFPLAAAQSENTEWSVRRYLVCSMANPHTTRMRSIVKMLDSGMPYTVSTEIALPSHFSSISSAVKRIINSPIHWILGCFTSRLAIYPDATTMRMIETTSPMIRFTRLPWLAPATARTLSSDIATSAMMIVCTAAQNVAPHSLPSSLCSCARISR